MRICMGLGAFLWVWCACQPSFVCRDENKPTIRFSCGVLIVPDGILWDYNVRSIFLCIYIAPFACLCMCWCVCVCVTPWFALF